MNKRNISFELKLIKSEDGMIKRFKKGVPWKGYDVYEPVYKGCPVIGLPHVVLANQKEVRWSNDSECFEYMSWRNSKKMVLFTSAQVLEAYEEKYEELPINPAGGSRNNPDKRYIAMLKNALRNNRRVSESDYAVYFPENSGVIY